MIKHIFNLFDYNTLIVKKDDNGLKNKYANMVVEIEGDPVTRRNSLTPRSTPILLEFELNIANNKNNDSFRCMVVDFELMDEDVILSNKKVGKNRFYKNANGNEFESSVGYLNKTHKRVYMENGTNVNNDDELLYESKEVKLSECTNKRYKRKMTNFDCVYNKIAKYNNFREVLKLEEWLFGN
ncbi:hypothetical protein FG379_001542 [Cryptosporidium bovis]|uniref:uncharacterized protein n=1 Tax=Cryptosporidium bovis TaxID=310047 RepID=UPI003519EDA4|nr:hypothetical protein FG379_001542 [Cryptosporidium bovis]